MQQLILTPLELGGIRGFGCCKYWLIGAWSELESPSIDFSSPTSLGLERLESVTWGAFLLVIVCGPTHGSNVIMSSTTILRGLMSGSFVCLKCYFVFVVCLVPK
jgi:hypothetical protein